MARIGIIAPDDQVYNKIPAIARELGIEDDIALRLAVREEALSVAQYMEQNGADVIVSRGATVEMLLHSGIRTPVVTISLSIQDISTMLLKAKKLTGLNSPRIAVVTYTHITLDLRILSALIDADLRVYHTGFSREAVENTVRETLKDGADVLVGGPTTQQALSGYSTPFITYETGASSVRQALTEAKLIADARKLEQERASEFKAVVAATKDAIVTLAPSGRIRLANPGAAKLLRLPPDPVGEDILDYCPVPDIRESLKTGKPITDELVTVTGQQTLISVAPTLVRGEVTGAVLSCQPAQHIVELEAKIRKSLSEKGLVARHALADIVGDSPQMQSTRQKAARFAAVDDGILIHGETGTGKELFAQAVHNASPRRKGPFVALNCAALPPTLLESELFGYEEGAFTGANRKGKPGMFELAHRGTIFLDEVSAMDHYGQTRLLRVLQERNVLRLGSDKYLPVDFRVIAASNVNLWTLVESGAFREDLYYRLNVLPLSLPPLRQRRGDIALLAAHFTREQYDGKDIHFTPEAVRVLEDHPWPGNVRELRHCIRRICLTADLYRITENDALDALAVPGPSFSMGNRTEKVVPRLREGANTDTAERQQIIRAIADCNGRLGKAAEKLGMNRSSLYRKMRKLHIQKGAR